MKKIGVEIIADRFPNEEVCISYLEKLMWNGIPMSPFAPNSKVYYCKDGRYKCRDTGKYFNVKTNTIFHNSKIPLQKWFSAIWILSDSATGITSVKLSNDLDISQKTAWFMIHRIKKYFEVPKPRTLKVSTESMQQIDDTDKYLENDRLKMTDWLNLMRK